jgi:hypothetical protein
MELSVRGKKNHKENLVNEITHDKDSQVKKLMKNK